MAAPTGPGPGNAAQETEVTTVQRKPAHSPVATYVGIAFAVVGFAAIGLAWNGAAELDFVQGQFPYFISGGLTGIGLIFVGVVILLIDTLRRDSAERSEQMKQLTATVAALNKHLSPADTYDPQATGEFRPRPRVSGNGQDADDTQQLPPVGTESWDAGT